jgi:hypothetical protein
MQSVLLDAADHRRSPATMPGYHRGRPPGNKGELYPADPPTVEEVVAVMRTVGDHPHGERLRALTALHRGELDQARAVIAAFDADCEAAFESDYRSLREVALAHLASAPLEAKAVVDHAQSGDYAEWPTWLSLAVDLLPQLPDDELLRDTLGTLQAGIAPQTSPIVAAQSARLEASSPVAQATPPWPLRAGPLRLRPPPMRGWSSTWPR